MNDIKVPSDNPIEHPEEDVLGRADTAKSFAQHVLNLDVSKGTVVGVIGPWGSGKTSFINFACREFETKGISILQFNPWMFSGTEQLARKFFIELSVKMRQIEGLKKVGNLFGKLWLNLIGGMLFFACVLWVPGMESLAVLLGKFFDRFQKRSTDIDQVRIKISETLEEYGSPVIVVIDDIDRLTFAEIRDIFKLVRLTASFPNLIYILAFDRFRVERALGGHEVSRDSDSYGRDFLEKIIQFPFDLPEIQPDRIEITIDHEIEMLLGRVKATSPPRDEIWLDVYTEIVSPLVRNMRDVRRYIAAIQSAVVRLEDRVEIVDVLALEAVRVFLPDVFKHIPDMIEILTVTSTPQANARHLERSLMEVQGDFNPGEEDKKKIQQMIKSAGKRKNVALAMVRRLFPDGSKYLPKNYVEPSSEWITEQLKNRRVAHESNLRFYLEHTVGDDLLAHYHAKQMLQYLADRVELEKFMQELDIEQRLGAILKLEAFENDFHQEHVEPGLVVLFNLFTDMPVRPLNLQVESRGIIKKAARHILHALRGDTTTIESVVYRTWTQLESFSSKLALIEWVGNRKNVGGKLVTENVETDLKEKLCEEIQMADPSGLAGEVYLANIVQFVKVTSGPLPNSFDLPDLPTLTFAAFWSSQGISGSGVAGSRVAHHSLTVDKEFLTFLYGDETALKVRIASLRAHAEDIRSWLEQREIPPEEAKSLLERVEKCLNEQ